MKWDASKEIKAFQDDKQASLSTFEEFEEGKHELKTNDPGYFAKLITKIIDNVQISFENIYVRVEDEISYPEKPFSIGFILKKAHAFTANKDWKYEYVEGAEEIYKSIVINNFSIFFNYGDKSEVFIESIMKQKGIEVFKEFALLDCNGGRPNRYVLNKLNTDLRLVLNKDPKKNMHPQVSAYLRVGMMMNQQLGKTIDLGHFELCVEAEQITVMMKYLEFIGKFSKFQTEVISKFTSRDLNEEEKQPYFGEYFSFVQAVRDKNEKLKEVKQANLLKMEENFTVAPLKKLRIIIRKALDFQDMKESLQKETNQKLKAFEEQKGSTMTNIGCILIIFNFYCRVFWDCGFQRKNPKSERRKGKIFARIN